MVEIRGPRREFAEVQSRMTFQQRPLKGDKNGAKVSSKLRVHAGPQET